MRKIILLGICALMSAFAFGQTKTVAVLAPVDRNNSISYANKLLIRSSFSNAISQTQGLEVYNRADVDAILSEHDFQHSGLVNDADIKTIGSMTGAQYILVVEVAKDEGYKLVIHAQILDVESSRMELSDYVTTEENAEKIRHSCTALVNRMFGLRRDLFGNVSQKSATLFSSDKQNIAAYEAQKIRIYNRGGRMFLGETELDKKMYARFLDENCPEAFAQYQHGRKLVVAGGCLTGIGALITAGGVFFALPMAEQIMPEPEVLGFTMLGIGGASMLLGSTILIPVGVSVQKEKARTVFNKTCAKPQYVSLNFQYSNNGLGLALNF